MPSPIATLLGIYLFIYAWAVPMLMLDLVPAWGEWMGGFLIILQGSLLALWLAWEQGARGAMAAFVIAVLAYLVEGIGVSTGIPFGPYSYTSVLGLQLGGAVPLAIPFAWLIVVPGAYMTAAALRRTAYILPVAALLALWLDLLIEPVAAYVTGYWQWQVSGPYYGVPTTNFFAWGATALVLVVLLHLLTPKLIRTARAAWLPMLVFALNVIQFALVNAAYRYWWAALLGLGLLLCIWWLWKRPHAATGGQILRRT